MKSLIAIAIAALSMGAFAQGDLNAMKQQANSHIDKKMSMLQSAKGCVNGATSMEGYKACKYDMHEDMKMQKMEAMEEKKVQKDSEQ